MITIDTATNQYDGKQIVKITTDKKQFSVIISEEDGGKLDVFKYMNPVSPEIMLSQPDDQSVVIK